MRRPTRTTLGGTLGAVLLLTVAAAGGEEASHPHERGHADGDHAHDAPATDTHDDQARDDHGHDDHAKEAFSVAVFERHGVQVATAGPGEVDVGVDLPGEVRPNGDRIAHLAPRFPGVVREVRAHVGDTVAAGDVLAVIESDSLVPYELRAGFAGTVVDKHITPGEAVTRDRSAFIVVDLATVWIEVTVYQSVLPRLRLGQPVVVRAGAAATHAEGVVSYVSPVVDQTTRTASARVVLANPDGVWRPGLFVTATILEPVRAAVVVPRRALHRLDGAAVVFVVEDERFTPRRVTVGATGRSLVEIAGGLGAGERFADEGSFLVKADLAKGAAGHDH